MKFDPLKHHRQSIRLRGYDYSSPGVYFVTLCSYNRMLIFQNNEIKKILKMEWLNLLERFNNIRLDEFIIMPNHLHGIIRNPNRDKKRMYRI